MLLPPASCPVFNPGARQGGTFSQLLNECLLRHLEVEIACKVSDVFSSPGDNHCALWRVLASKLRVEDEHCEL